MSEEVFHILCQLYFIILQSKICQICTTLSPAGIGLAGIILFFNRNIPVRST